MSNPPNSGEAIDLMTAIVRRIKDSTLARSKFTMAGWYEFVKSLSSYGKSSNSPYLPMEILYIIRNYVDKSYKHVGFTVPMGDGKDITVSSILELCELYNRAVGPSDMIDTSPSMIPNITRFYYSLRTDSWREVCEFYKVNRKFYYKLYKLVEYYLDEDVISPVTKMFSEWYTILIKYNDMELDTTQKTNLAKYTYDMWACRVAVDVCQFYIYQYITIALFKGGSTVVKFVYDLAVKLKVKITDAMRIVFACNGHTECANTICQDEMDNFEWIMKLFRRLGSDDQHIVVVNFLIEIGMLHRENWPASRIPTVREYSMHYKMLTDIFGFRRTNEQKWKVINRGPLDVNLDRPSVIAAYYYLVLPFDLKRDAPDILASGKLILTTDHGRMVNRAFELYYSKFKKKVEDKHPEMQEP